jgi:hypothetical protein
MDPALNEQDLRNLRLLLNRIPATGVDEAKVLVVLAAKIEGLLMKAREEAGG